MTHGKTVRLVITGGPCAGKTAAMERLRGAVEQAGWQVITVPETATELILMGVTPWNTPQFQKLRVARQLQAEEAAGRNVRGSTLILLDRGIADTRAYTDAEEYRQILREHGLTEESVMARYDGVIHLTSAAKGAAESYSLQTNAARTETVQEAVTVDDRTVQAWASHPDRVILEAEKSFERKMEKLLRAVWKLISRSVSPEKKI